MNAVQWPPSARFDLPHATRAQDARAPIDVSFQNLLGHATDALGDPTTSATRFDCISLITRHHAPTDDAALACVMASPSPAPAAALVPSYDQHAPDRSVSVLASSERVLSSSLPASTSASVAPALSRNLIETSPARAFAWAFAPALPPVAAPAFIEPSGPQPASRTHTPPQGATMPVLVTIHDTEIGLRITAMSRATEDELARLRDEVETLLAARGYQAASLVINAKGT